MSAKFPTAIATDRDLTVQKDRAQSTLTGALTASSTSGPVVTGSKFQAGQVITIDNEQILIYSVSGNTLNFGYASAGNLDGRGYNGTSAASHANGSLVSGNVVAVNHNALADEIKAIETALGASMANVPTVAYPIAVNKGGTAATTASGARTTLGAAVSGANNDITSLSALSTPLSVPQGGTGVATLTGIVQGNGASAHTAVAASSELAHLRRKPNAGATPVYEFATPIEVLSTDYDFAAQTPGGSLSVGSNTITLSPVPLGVNGANTSHYLYISGGTGTAEAALITGGTAVSGATSGTVIVTCANTHSGAWTIKSASAGIREAILSASGAVTVTVPIGSRALYQKVVIDKDSVKVIGVGTWGTIQRSGDAQGALQASSTRLTWSGPASGRFFELLPPANGILSDVEICNLSLDCEDGPNRVLEFIWAKSINFCKFERISARGCIPDATTGGIYLSSGDGGVSSNRNVYKCQFRDMDLVQYTCAGPMFYFNQGGNVSSDITNCVFQNIAMSLYGSGIYAYACDSNKFYNIQSNSLTGGVVDWWNCPATSPVSGGNMFYATHTGATRYTNASTVQAVKDVFDTLQSDEIIKDQFVLSNLAKVLITGNSQVSSTLSTYANLPTASAAWEGQSWVVADSNTALLGATVAGGGSHHVLAYCNGTSWVVSAADGNRGTGTASGGAVTLNKQSGVVTSESLTTAAAASYTLTLTNSFIGVGSQVYANAYKGTSTDGTAQVVGCTPASGSVVIIVKNIHATQAFNGTIKIQFLVN